MTRRLTQFINQHPRLRQLDHAALAAYLALTATAAFTRRHANPVSYALMGIGLLALWEWGTHPIGIAVFVTGGVIYALLGDHDDVISGDEL